MIEKTLHLHLSKHSYQTYFISICPKPIKTSKSIAKYQCLFQYLRGNLNPLKSDISLLEAPLRRAQHVTHSHQHEHPAIIEIVLLRVTTLDFNLAAYVVKHFAEFYCVFENWILIIVARLMFYAIIDYKVRTFENGEIPVVSIINRHDQSISFAQILLLKKSLDLCFSFREYVGGKICIQKFVRRFSIKKSLFQHLQIDVDDVVIQPLTKIQTPQRTISQLLNTFKTCALDFATSSLLIFPILPNLFELLE